MSVWLVVVVTLIQAGASVASAAKRDWAGCIMLGGFAISGVGVVMKLM